MSERQEQTELRRRRASKLIGVNVGVERITGPQRFYLMANDGRHLLRNRLNSWKEVDLALDSMIAALEMRDEIEENGLR